MNKQIVFVCGLSGVGKSFIVNKFVEKHPEFAYVDLDTFYKIEKPTVKLSNGKVVTNWDDPEAIEWDDFNTFINGLQYEKIIISGFLPLRDRLKFKVDLFVELSYGDKSDEEIIEKCIMSRRESKKFETEEKIKKDELMVREVTFPIYKETIEKYPPDVTLITFIGNVRTPVSSILKGLEFWIKELSNKPKYEEVVYVAYYFSDRRKENLAKIYGVFKKKEDAIEKARKEAQKESDSDTYLGAEEFTEDKDGNCYWLSLGGGEDNFIVKKEIIQ